MKHAGLAASLCAVALTVACDGSIASFGDPQPTSGSDPGSPATPGAPVSPNPQQCTSDAQCTAPYVCHLKAARCVPPAAKDGGLCNPIEGQSCPSPAQCLDGVCQPPPGACQNNDQCPIGFLCQSGQCIPDGKGGTKGCTSDAQCGAGLICLSGDCKPKEICSIAHAPDRLQGSWELSSLLHVRDGLKGLTKGLLSLATTLQKAIEGKFSIKGVPSFVSSVLGLFVQDAIKKHVPSWGQQLIGWLSTVDDAIDDLRVSSAETLSAVGQDQYTGVSEWQTVQFEFRGQTVSTKPDQIPGLGKVTTTTYTAREVCGTLFIDKHKVKNQMGKLFRWAIEATLMGLSCSNNGPCFKDLQSMFDQLINCQMLGASVSQSSNSTIASLGPLVEAACVAQKQSLVSMLIKELDDLALKLTLMSLSAKADIGNGVLTNGRWYGTLGFTLGAGNFEGSFSGQKH